MGTREGEELSSWLKVIHRPGNVGSTAGLLFALSERRMREKRHELRHRNYRGCTQNFEWGCSTFTEGHEQ